MRLTVALPALFVAAASCTPDVASTGGGGSASASTSASTASTSASTSGSVTASTSASSSTGMDCVECGTVFYDASSVGDCVEGPCRIATSPDIVAFAIGASHGAIQRSTAVGGVVPDPDASIPRSIAARGSTYLLARSTGVFEVSGTSIVDVANGPPATGQITTDAAYAATAPGVFRVFGSKESSNNRRIFTTYDTPALCAIGNQGMDPPHHLAADPGHVYFAAKINAAERLWRCPLPTGTIESVADYPNADTIRAVAFDGASVVVLVQSAAAGGVDDRTLEVRPLAGTPTVAAVTASVDRVVQLDGFVYWAEPHAIRRALPATLDASTVVATDTETIVDFAVDAGGVYWIDLPAHIRTRSLL